MSTEGKKSFLLRCDQSLFDKVEKWSDEEARSVNGQIIHVLEYVLERRHLRKSMGKQKQKKSFWTAFKSLFR